MHYVVSEIEKNGSTLIKTYFTTEELALTFMSILDKKFKNKMFACWPEKHPEIHDNLASACKDYNI